MTDPMAGREASTTFDENGWWTALSRGPAACVLVRRRDGRLVEVNDAFTALTGWARDEVVGRPPADLRLIGDDPSSPQVSPFDSSAELRDAEVDLRTRGGEHRRVSLSTGDVGFSGEPHTVTIMVDVTPRAQARAAANRLAAIVESSDDAIISKDLHGIVRSWNRGAERIFGYSAEEMVGESILRIIPHDRRDEEERILRTIAQGEGIVNLETTRRRKDGALIDVSVTTSPVRDARGRVIGASKIARDITDRHRAEAARDTSEARYRALFEASPDGIVIGERHGPFLDVNGTIARLTGYTRAELLTMRSSDLVAADQRARLETALSSITADDFYRDEWDLCRKDGSTFRAEVIGALLPDGTVMGVVRDVTAQRRSESRFRRLVDSNAQGVTFWRRDGTITDANDAFLRIVGVTRAELAAGEVNWIDMTPVEHAAADADCMRQLVEGGVCKPYEKEYIRNDGSRVPVLVGAATLEDGPDEGVSFVVDLTEQKKLEQQFFRAQRMESVGTLAGGIAHDLNNVLAPILLSTGLLRTELSDRGQLALLETVQSCAQRGADLVQQVLQFARGVEGRVVTIDPRRVVRELIQVVRDTFPRSIAVSADLPADPWTVEGDPTQMHQVLLNLAVNARDAMPRGGVLTVAMENMVIDETYASMNLDAKPGRYVVFTVSDTGEGISPAVRERIFEPFFTTKEVGKGTGLGLSTSAAIVKSHGGFVNVYSEVGQGTRFKVYWPAREAFGEAAVEASEPGALPRGDGELILVIDDEEAVRMAARSTLERFGYRVLLAAHGAEGVAIFAVHRAEIAVVLTDMAMPVMDGPATIVALKSLDRDATIIVTSGLTTDHALATAESAGVQLFLPKPYTAHALLRTLHDALHP